MSRDPYMDVKGDVENNLASLQSLIASSSASSSSTSHNGLAQEIRETISLLEADIEDLEETVRAVESVGDRWGIPEGEKRARRQFVDRVKREVAALRAKVPQRSAKSGQAGVRYTDNPDAAERGGNGVRGREDAAEDPEEARRWEMEEQQMLVRQQDDTLGFISGTLHNLASQAGLIGTEAAVQSEMLDDLGDRVDATDNRLKRASRKMQDFIRRNEETKSGYCICILIIVLIILLVLVILT